MCRSERISRSGRDDQQSVGGTKRGTTKLAAAATATVGSFSQRQSSASSQDAKPGRHHGFVGSGRQRSWHGQRRQRDGRFSSETTGHQHPTSSVAICKLFQRRATNEFQPWTNPSKVRSIFFFLNFYFFFPIEFASADAFDSWCRNRFAHRDKRRSERSISLDRSVRSSSIPPSSSPQENTDTLKSEYSRPMRLVITDHPSKFPRFTCYKVKFGWRTRIPLLCN